MDALAYRILFWIPDEEDLIILALPHSLTQRPFLPPLFGGAIGATLKAGA